MKKFALALDAFGNLTETDNKARGFKSSGSALCDVTWSVSSRKIDIIAPLFNKLIREDLNTAIKWLFWLRDVRGGLGERDTFRALFGMLLNAFDKNSDADMQKILKLAQCVSKYGRWDDLVYVIGNNKDKALSEKLVAIIKAQLNADLESLNQDGNVSLLAKWLPSENTSSKKTRALACKMRNAFGYTSSEYRKVLSKLRKQIDVVERKISANEWDQVNYSGVPSLANLKYKNAFMRHDQERRQKFLEDVKSGKSKINAGAVFPHDIISKYCALVDDFWCMDNPPPIDADETLEQMWKALPEYNIKNTLVVRDGSGSMTHSLANSHTAMLDLATALAVYASEHNAGLLKDKFITFSENPKFVDLTECKTLAEKIVICASEDEVANTNIKKVFELILNIAVKNKLAQEELPEQILIVSDMQFDQGAEEWDETLFQSIQKEFEKHEYVIPRLIFWNVGHRAKTPIPLKNNELGLTLVSGFSLHILEMVLGNELDPEKAILKILDKYNEIIDFVK